MQSNEITDTQLTAMIAEQNRWLAQEEADRRDNLIALINTWNEATSPYTLRSDKEHAIERVEDVHRRNKMRIINLTPHALHIRRADGTDITVQPCGTAPRLEVSRADCAPVVCDDGVEIAVSRATFGALTGMPKEPSATVLKWQWSSTALVRQT